MLKTVFIAILLAITPLIASAGYYVNDYDPDYVPYNLQDVIDSLENESCVGEVKFFDATYNEYLKQYGTPISIGDILDVNFGALKEDSEEEFRQCLILMRTELQVKSIKACDFNVIDSLTKDEERTYQSEIKYCEDMRALDSCDYTYIEGLDGGDKFKYRLEIDDCEKEFVSDIKETTPEFESMYKPPAIIPVTVPKPTITPNSSVQVTQDPTTLNDVNTSTSKTIEMTEDELNQLIEQRVTDAMERPIHEELPNTEKPSLFKRVINFLFGWW